MEILRFSLGCVLLYGAYTEHKRGREAFAAVFLGLGAVFLFPFLGYIFGGRY